ncbi:aminoacyl-tRNA deacylase [Marinobacter zhanjiangensis]|uniref:Deacylase n=1 Tax=Marinobacter zhanjiangensis TaxID=578215 RepID=A0ABQ3ANG3_9GAMM|nr:YbaK/EbsC family protein [Marinobacter zhanjiangensis]GGY58670.1 deacylase [Marinobacter zhanjiangensis]
MPGKKLKAFLKKSGADFIALSHPPAYTAQQLAHHGHIPGDRVAKTVIIELDGKMAMLVMPSTWRIHWDRLSNVLETDFLELADEMEFKDRFPDCEVGAIPPFGNLFDMAVYCCEALTQQPDIAFPAGSHEESIHMKTDDFLALVDPVVIEKGFIRPGTQKPAWMQRRRKSSVPSDEQIEHWELAGY